jgi:hypothetical protein
MSKDHRLLDALGHPIPWTCSNAKYQTNLAKGHGGNVFDSPLIRHGGFSLRLEHVVEKPTGGEMYWLMWYEPSGIPALPLSAVFDRDDLEQMIGQLARFVP